MDNLCDQASAAGVKQELKNLPERTAIVFEKSLEQIERQQETNLNLAKHIFAWVLHAQHHLTFDLIHKSIAFSEWMKSRNSSGGVATTYHDHQTTRHLLPICAGLVVVDPETERVRLVHESLIVPLKAKSTLMTHHPHVEIAETCISCLLNESPAPDGAHSTLFEYAAAHWKTHWSLCDEEDRIEMHEMIFELLKNSEKLCEAFKAMDPGNDGTFHGMTGLHAAVYLDVMTWVTSLIEDGCMVNSVCANRQSALHWAIRLGRCDAVQILLRNDADVDIQDLNKETPLHKALEAPGTVNERIVEILLEHGASLKKKNLKGRMPLTSAIEHSSTSIAETLIKGQRNVNEEIYTNWTSLRSVIYGKFENDEESLPPKGVRKLDADIPTTVRKAVENHRRSLIRLLLSKGVDLKQPCKDGWLPLMYVAQNGYKDTLEWLLERGTDQEAINQRDTQDFHSPMRWAFTYEHLDVVEVLIQHGADVNESYEDGWTPLNAAVCYPDIATVRLLLRKGAAVNKPGTIKNCLKGATPLINAICLKNNDLVWHLLQGAAHPDCQDDQGKSAL